MGNKLYIGLDVGSDSVGWAATDENYDLCRIKGKTAWGARIFDAASDAQGRRGFRTARRRLQRRKRRVAWLEELFADELYKVDPSFLIRLHSSALHDEDKPEEARGACPLFIHKNEEKAFYKKYPTIWHLRQALVENRPEAFTDLRLIYLAIHHIVKYRGNFLRDGEINVEQFDFEDLNKLNEYFAEAYAGPGEEIEEDEVDAAFTLLDESNFQEFRDRFEKDENKSAMKKALGAIMNPVCEPLKPYVEMFCSLVAGGDFSSDKLKNGCEKATITLNCDFDAKLPEFETALNGDIRLLEIAKRLYDYKQLKGIVRGCDSLSQAFAAIYDSHKEQLATLKGFAKTIDAKEDLHGKDSVFFKLFQDEHSKENYPAFVHVRSLEKRASIEDFNKYVKKVIDAHVASLTPEQTSIWEKMKVVLIDRHQLLETIALRSTSLVPHQLHERELKIIIENAKEHGFAFFGDIEKRLIELFEFKIPYYYGPLSDKTEHSNVVFKEGVSKEPITPWNFKDKIDDGKTKDKFMNGLTNKCTYLRYADVLPRNSLIFEEYDTYNKINGAKIDGMLLDEATRERLYAPDGVFSKKKMTSKGVERMIKSFTRNDISLSGLSEADGLNNSSHAFFLGGPFYFDLTSRHTTDYKKAETIIRYLTIFVDCPEDGIKLIEKEFPELTKEQLKALKGLNVSGWCSLSGELLTLPSVDKNGEIQERLIDVLRHSGRTFMAIIKDENYGFLEQIERLNEEHFGGYTMKQRIDEMLEDTPPSMRRSIIQALRIVEEIEKFGKKTPDAIAVEVTREVADPKRKGSYTDDRRKIIENFLKKLKGEEEKASKAELQKEIKREDITADRLRGKHLYLYFCQNGKDIYTGKRIDIEDVLRGTRYDTDHIIPQSFIKDDSLDNLVLVDRELNQTRKNRYPIPLEICNRAAMIPFWKRLKDCGMMSPKKYDNLTRTTPLSEDELASFVHAQINVVNQANKKLLDILKIRYPETKLIFSKAAYPSQIRKELEIAKLRDLNDTHHAVDAYLNIITGVELTNRYSDMRHIKAMAKAAKESPDEEVRQSLNMERFIHYKILRKVDGERTPTELGQKILKNSERHDFLLTYRASYSDQGFYDQNPLRKGEGAIPLHQKEGSPFLATDKYGGYSGSSAEYNVIATIVKDAGTKKEKKRKFVAPVAHYLMGKSREELERSLIPLLKLKEGETAVFDWGRPLLNGQKLLINGCAFLFTNMNENQVIMKPFRSIFLPSDCVLYLKSYGAMLEKKLTLFQTESDTLTFGSGKKDAQSWTFSKEHNVEIIRILIELAKQPCYDFVPMVTQLLSYESAESLMDIYASSLEEQYKLIIGLISLFTRKSSALCKLKPVDKNDKEHSLNNYFSKRRGVMLNLPVKIIYESVTGLVNTIEEL